MRIVSIVLTTVIYRPFSCSAQMKLVYSYYMNNIAILVHLDVEIPDNELCRSTVLYHKVDLQDRFKASYTILNH